MRREVVLPDPARGVRVLCLSLAALALAFNLGVGSVAAQQPAADPLDLPYICNSNQPAQLPTDLDCEATFDGEVIPAGTYSIRLGGSDEWGNQADPVVAPETIVNPTVDTTKPVIMDVTIEKVGPRRWIVRWKVRDDRAPAFGTARAELVP
jgi:hypothetical protein